jgi:hypothetical protein
MSIINSNDLKAFYAGCLSAQGKNCEGWTESFACCAHRLATCLEYQIVYIKPDSPASSACECVSMVVDSVGEVGKLSENSNEWRSSSSVTSAYYNNSNNHTWKAFQ